MENDIIVDGALEVMMRQQMSSCQDLFRQSESNFELLLSHIKSRRKYVKTKTTKDKLSYNPLRDDEDDLVHRVVNCYQLTAEDSESEDKQEHCAPCSFQGFTLEDKIDSRSRHYQMLQTQLALGSQSIRSDEEEEIEAPLSIKIDISEETLILMYQDKNEFIYSFEKLSAVNPSSHNVISVENAVPVETRHGEDNHPELGSDVSVGGDHPGMSSVATRHTNTNENILNGESLEVEMPDEDTMMSESRISSVVGSYTAFYDNEDEEPELADLTSNKLPAHITETVWQSAENTRPQSGMTSELGGEEDDETNSNVSYLRRSASSRGYESDGWPTDISLADIDEDVDARLGQIYGGVPDVLPKQTYRYRLDLSRSGVHRPLRNYIHCGPVGAFSILLSSSCVVKDKGDAFVYLGEAYVPPREPRKKRRRWQRGSLNKGTKKKYKEKHDQEMTGGNLSLLYSLREHHAVRVIRSHSLKNEFAPPEGYRYDGLYHVLSAYQEKAYEGHTQYKFVFMHVESRKGAITNYPSLWGEEERPDSPPLWEITQDSFMDDSQFWKRAEDTYKVAVVPPSVLPGHLRPISRKRTMELPSFQLTVVNHRVAVVVLHRLSACSIVRSMTTSGQEHAATERNDCSDEAIVVSDQPLLIRRRQKRTESDWRSRIDQWNTAVTAATIHQTPPEIVQCKEEVETEITSETSKNQDITIPQNDVDSVNELQTPSVAATAKQKEIITRNKTKKSDISNKSMPSLNPELAQSSQMTTGSINKPFSYQAVPQTQTVAGRTASLNKSFSALDTNTEKRNKRKPSSANNSEHIAVNKRKKSTTQDKIPAHCSSEKNLDGPLIESENVVLVNCSTKNTSDKPTSEAEDISPKPSVTNTALNELLQRQDTSKSCEETFEHNICRNNNSSQFEKVDCSKDSLSNHLDTTEESCPKPSS